MKLLFDQNISYRMVNKLRDVFPDSKHIKKAGLENKSDFAIRKFAEENNFTIVTFDSDYSDLIVFHGAFPKIIWLKTGNLTTGNLEKLFRRSADMIKDFIQNPEMKNVGCLELIE